jgi:two-component system sensor histidine kinase BarA
MDLQMPGMDGIESSRLIRQWENGGQHTFIVALTASYLPEHGQTLFDAGIDNYISKPFELEHIQRLLNYSVRASLTNAEQPAILDQEISSSQVLDIQKGIDQVGGDIDSYQELLGEFVDGLPQRMKIIQQLFVSMNMVELSRAAHNISGVAASLGALQLSDCARKLDKQSSEGYTESIALLLQEIQIVAAKLLEFSNNFLAKKKISVGSV